MATVANFVGPILLTVVPEILFQTHYRDPRHGMDR
jgi:hypothetical protein